MRSGAPPGELRLGGHLIGAVALVAVMAVVLAAMGRVWWCRAGDAELWSGAAEIASRHNSQHLVDPYTFTHALHGLLFYAIAWAVAGGRVGWLGRAWLGLGAEVAWEIVENTPFVIERYRAATISLDYYGDSVANSIGDVLAYGVGYAAAGAIPVWVSVAAFFLVDAALGFWIRDGLFLNVLMLVWPVESIARWQKGG